MVPSHNESVFLMNKFWHVSIPTLTTPRDTCWRQVRPPFPPTVPYTLEQIVSFDQLMIHLTLQEAICVLFPLEDQQYTAVLKSALLKHLSMLLLRLRIKSAELYYHSLHVLHITYIFTRMLLLPKEISAVILLAALFHDVGKILVPNEILQKPSHLTEQEFEEIKKHCTHGTMMLLRLNSLREVAGMVFHHHERWDGRGYPLGLQGRAIPLGARIIAAADAFAVMTSQRTYRTPISPALALAELSRCAGSQFDPLLVEHFCANLIDIELD